MNTQMILRKSLMSQWLRLTRAPLLLFSFLTACKPSPEELEAREKAEQAARLAAKERERAEKERAAAEKASREQLEKQRQQATIKRWQTSRTEKTSFYAEMAPKAREATLRERCVVDGACDRTWELIIDAASTSSERKRLESLANKLCDPCEVSGRDAFVGDLAVDLVRRGARGEPAVSVDAKGPGKRHLAVSGPFCSEEFLSELVDGVAYGMRIRDAGFKTASCNGPSSSAMKIEER